MSFPNHKGRPGLMGGSLPRNNLRQLFSILKGGPGSGNIGHVGVPGKRGGSAPKGGAYLGLPIVDNADKLSFHSTFGRGGYLFPDGTLVDAGDQHLKLVRETVKIHGEKARELFGISHDSNFGVYSEDDGNILNKAMQEGKFYRIRLTSKGVVYIQGGEVNRTHLHKLQELVIAKGIEGSRVVWHDGIEDKLIDNMSFDSFQTANKVVKDRVYGGLTLE